MKTMELFGNIYEEVEDNNVESSCALCAFLEICNESHMSILPCERVDGSCNRYFVLANEKSNNGSNYDEVVDSGTRIF